MLADAEHIEPDLIGQLDFLDQVLQPLSRRCAGRHVGEGVESDFHIKPLLVGAYM
jgi:hypothetical protein